MVETEAGQEFETEAGQGESPLLHAEQALALRLGSTRQPIITSELGGRRTTGPMFFS